MSVACDKDITITVVPGFIPPLVWEGGPGTLIRFRDPTLDGIAVLVSGGSGVYDFQLTGGAFPTGVSIDSTTGALVGVPTEFYDPSTLVSLGVWPFFLKSYAITITVTDTVNLSLAPLIINTNVGYYMRILMSGILDHVPTNSLDGYSTGPLYSLVSGFTDVIVGYGEQRYPDSPNVPILPVLGYPGFAYSMIPSVGGGSGGIAFLNNTWRAGGSENVQAASSSFEFPFFGTPWDCTASYLGTPFSPLTTPGSSVAPCSSVVAGSLTGGAPLGQVAIDGTITVSWS